MGRFSFKVKKGRAFGSDSVEVCAYEKGKLRGCVSATEADWMREDKRNRTGSGKQPYEAEFLWAYAPGTTKSSKTKRFGNRSVERALIGRAAQEACKRGVELISDVDIAHHSMADERPVWQELVRERVAGTRKTYLSGKRYKTYRIGCPAPSLGRSRRKKR